MAGGPGRRGPCRLRRRHSSSPCAPLLHGAAHRRCLLHGWGDVRDGTIFVRQDKTKKLLEIRLHQRLAEELARVPRTALTILSDAKGRPPQTRTLRDRLQDWAKERGHRVVPHGLRKNAVNALLEAGCSAAETAAVSGQSLAMVEHYAKRRSTRKLASAAILKMEASKR